MAGYVEKGVIRLHEKVGHDIWRMQIELPQTAKSDTARTIYSYKN